jgi:hypothetical protein
MSKPRVGLGSYLWKSFQASGCARLLPLENYPGCEKMFKPRIGLGSYLWKSFQASGVLGSYLWKTIQAEKKCPSLGLG